MRNKQATNMRSAAVEEHPVGSIGVRKRLVHTTITDYYAGIGCLRSCKNLLFRQHITPTRTCGASCFVSCIVVVHRGVDYSSSRHTLICLDSESLRRSTVNSTAMYTEMAETAKHYELPGTHQELGEKALPGPHGASLRILSLCSPWLPSLTELRAIISVDGRKLLTQKQWECNNATEASSLSKRQRGPGEGPQPSSEKR